MDREPRRIHITAVGSPAKEELQRLGVGDIHGLVALAQRGAGDCYRVTASEAMITAEENDHRGGRTDDPERIAEVEALLADDTVAAVITIRGGAWFVRLLDRIHFDVLDRRQRPLHIFGFSEMTPLVAIAGQYAKVVGVYDLGPAFLFGGMKRRVQTHLDEYAGGMSVPPEHAESFADGWARARYPEAFADFFREVADVLQGVPCPQVPTGRWIQGPPRATQRIRITGGNLSLVAAMIASPYAGAFETRGKWIALEEVNESPEQFDRMMAGLKLAGLFERADGVILGDFHNRDGDLREAASEVLKYHLPAGRDMPVIMLDNFGHTWPIAPLPFHRELTLRCTPRDDGPAEVRIEIPWTGWAEA